ncbi:WXG100 family type VII secretion target [Micromonospora rubida]|uniref:WXG100 family type VII secretion target n=1 Tax=Micromonospora rubida TaxID=2697657 RepID=UPI0013788935|nr:WXG100 family type VII secretion target [Micromonospora rubida]NBE82876.1 hypothetical protein [Micromonospora rubida]
MSEYTARYEHVSHETLYEAVKAGDPAQIDGLAAKWDSMKGTLDGLSRDLQSDLDKLANGWTGNAGREFQRRLSLVVDHSTTLSEGMADVRQGLTLMATHLRTAKKDAESPDESDDHDKAISGAVKGAALGPAGAIIGGFMGHNQDKAEKKKAHRRMVQVVAELAAGYDLSAYGRLVQPRDPHRDLPFDPNTSTSTPSAGPGASVPGAAPGPGNGNPSTGHKTVSAPGSPGHVPGIGSTPGGEHGGSTPGGVGTVGGSTPSGGEHGGSTPGGVGTVVDGPGTGTSLAGADPSLGGVQLAGGPAGTGSGGTSVATAGPGAGSLFGTPTGSPAGGVLNGALGGGTGSLAGSARGGAAGTARPTGGLGGVEQRAATGMGRGGANGSSGSRGGVLGGQGRPGEDQSDERLTWLTEDEMVWGNDDTGAPPVLGAS